MRTPQTNWSPGGADFFRALPVTMAVIAIWLVSFLANFLNIPFAELLAFNGGFPNILTGLLFYPLAYHGDLISLIFSGLMLYWFGGSLERGWGARTYLIFLAGVSLTSAMLWELGCLVVFGHLQPLATPWLLISSVIVGWAWLNPEQTVLLWFVLPVKAKWIGWGTIAIVFFMFPGGVSHAVFRILLGLAALGGVAFALAFVWYQRKWAWVPRRPRAKPSSRVIRHPASGPFGTLLRPYREWQRRRRVAKLQKTFKLDD